MESHIKRLGKNNKKIQNPKKINSKKIWSHFEVHPLGGIEKQQYHTQQAYFFQDLWVFFITHTY